MADEQKFADEMLTDDELDAVVGGTSEETFADGHELYIRGLLDNEAVSNIDVMFCLHRMGYTGYVSNCDGGLSLNENLEWFESPGSSNVYTDKKGNKITRAEFWANFDAENGTKIIR